MKKSLFFLLIVFFSFSFFPIVGFSTTPEISKWIKNISEGEGAVATGMDDYGPEIVVSGKTNFTNND